MPIDYCLNNNKKIADNAEQYYVLMLIWLNFYNKELHPSWMDPSLPLPSDWELSCLQSRPKVDSPYQFFPQKKHKNLINQS